MLPTVVLQKYSAASRVGSPRAATGPPFDFRYGGRAQKDSDDSNNRRPWTPTMHNRTDITPTGALVKTGQHLHQRHVLCGSCRALRLASCPQYGRAMRKFTSAALADLKDRATKGYLQELHFRPKKIKENKLNHLLM